AGYDVLPGSGLSTVRSDAEGRYKIERLSPWDGKEQRKWFEAETTRLRQAGREDQFFASSASGWLPEYPLTVRHPDYAVKRATVEKVPGEADVQLQPGAVIQGRVLFQENGQSRPAGRLTVRVTRENHEDDET